MIKYKDLLIIIRFNEFLAQMCERGTVAAMLTNIDVVKTIQNTSYQSLHTIQ